MRHRLESLGRFRAHALGWRIGRDEMRVRCFQIPEFAVQGIVLRIADGGPIVHVIAALMLADNAAQGGQSFPYSRLIFHVPCLHDAYRGG